MTSELKVALSYKQLNCDVTFNQSPQSQADEVSVTQPFNMD